MMKNVIKLIFLLFDLVIGCCVLLHAQVEWKVESRHRQYGLRAQSVAARRDKGFRDIRLEKESVGNRDAVWYGGFLQMVA